MNISQFLLDDEAQSKWLNDERHSMEAKEEFFSSWPHGEVKGFGIVVSGHMLSMELHLMPDGMVTRHLETFDPQQNEIVTLISDSIEAKTLQDFERIYAELRNRTLSGS